MKFEKYQHVERLGNTEAEGILKGKITIQPKIDGSNDSIYLDDNGDIKAASRNRQLTLEPEARHFSSEQFTKHKRVLGTAKIQKCSDSDDYFIEIPDKVVNLLHLFNGCTIREELRKDGNIYIKRD